MTWFSRSESDPRLKGTHRALPEFLDVPWTVIDVLLAMVAWTVAQVAIIFALKLVGEIVPGIATFMAGAVSGDNIMAVFALDLISKVAGLGVVALFLRKYHASIKELGWRRFDLARAIIYLVAVMAFFIFAAMALLALISWLVPGFNAHQAQSNEFIGAAASHANLALIALVLLPPVMEETIFRGFMFPAMAKKWGPVPGALVSSAIFGLAHLQANISVYTFLLGLLLCFMYVKLKSIVPGVALHMLNNYIAFLALTSS